MTGDIVPATLTTLLAAKFQSLRHVLLPIRRTRWYNGGASAPVARDSIQQNAVKPTRWTGSDNSVVLFRVLGAAHSMRNVVFCTAWAVWQLGQQHIRSSNIPTECKKTDPHCEVAQCLRLPRATKPKTRDSQRCPTKRHVIIGKMWLFRKPHHIHDQVVQSEFKTATNGAHIHI